MDSRLEPGGKYLLGTDGQGAGHAVGDFLRPARQSLLVGVVSGLIALTLGGLLGRARRLRRRRFESVPHARGGHPARLSGDPGGADPDRGARARAWTRSSSRWSACSGPTTRAPRAAAALVGARQGIHRGRARPGRWRARASCSAHLLPNALPPLIVVGTVQVAHAIALEATLSFLGLGLPTTEPSLGLLIANGYEYLLSGKYWISMYPGRGAARSPSSPSTWWATSCATSSIRGSARA